MNVQKVQVVFMESFNSQLHMAFSPAAERNREPIWTLLKTWLERIQQEQNLKVIDCLEIASGTGQHAAEDGWDHYQAPEA